MFTIKWGESHSSLHDSITSSVGLDCVAGKFCMVLTIKWTFQFGTVVAGMLVHTKAHNSFPTLLSDLVKNHYFRKNSLWPFLDCHQTPKLPSLHQHFFMWELASSTEAKQWHKWAESVGWQLRLLSQDNGFPLPASQVLKIATAVGLGTCCHLGLMLYQSKL